MSRLFHFNISLGCRDISLGISGYFIPLSLNISLWCPGNFIVLSLHVSLEFLAYFIALSLNISLGCLDYFIVLSLRISLGCPGGWSHDQFPKKVVKTKVIALHCSFQNQLELCCKVLLLWRYEVKDLQKHRVFFCFLCFSQWKQHQITWFHHIWKAERKDYNCCTVGNFPKKEGICPKREIDSERLQKITDRLQKSHIDYKVY
jgi:hypothetical protein